MSSQISGAVSHDDLQRPEPASWLEKLKDIASFSKIVRLFGACAVLASMSLFLLNGWTEANDVQRYLKLAAQTILLSGAGFALAFGLREQKGARVFFGLSLVSIAANFTVLGAMLFSVVQWDVPLGHYANALTWNVVTWAEFVPMLLGATLLLAGLANFGFRIFARNQAALLSSVFILLCGILLLPLRSSLWVSLLSILSVLIASKTFNHIRKGDGFIATAESKFAICLLYVPTIIMMTRLFALYHPGQFAGIVLCGFGYFALRFFSIQEAVKDLEKVSVLDRFSHIGQLIFAFFIAAITASLFSFQNLTVMTGIFLAIVSLFCLEVIYSGRHPNAKALFVNNAVIFASLFGISLGALGHSAAQNLVNLSFVLFALTCNTVVVNVSLSRGVVQFLSWLAAILAIALIWDMVTFVNLGNWAVIGGIGTLLILSASIVERFGLKWMLKDGN